VEPDAGRLGAFARSGEATMYIVTAAAAGERRGCLVGFVTQASIDPPRLLVCVSPANATYRLARSAGRLAVHLVPADQIELAALFGGETADDGVDKFARCAWSSGMDGLPLLDGCPTRMIGRVVGCTPFGDHAGFLLEPVEVAVQPGERPLRTADAAGIRPGHPA